MTCKYKITTFQSQQMGISTQFQFAIILDKNQNWHESNNFKSFQIISTGHIDQQEFLDQGPRNNIMTFKSYKANLKMNWVFNKSVQIHTYNHRWKCFTWGNQTSGVNLKTQTPHSHYDFNHAKLHEYYTNYTLSTKWYQDC